MRGGWLIGKAFIAFLNLHILFSSRSTAPAAKAAPLAMEDEIQHRLGGVFQAAIERFGSDHEASQSQTEDEEGESAVD